MGMVMCEHCSIAGYAGGDAVPYKCDFCGKAASTPTTDRDELVASVIERFRWRVERKQFAPSVAEDLTLMMDRIQADAATIAAKDAEIERLTHAISEALRLCYGDWTVVLRAALHQGDRKP